MFLKTIVLCLCFIAFNKVFAGDVFYNSCNDQKTSSAFIQTGKDCNVGFCEMKSLCKTDKGEMYVNHLCPSKENGTCPTMIECLDDNSITHKEDFNPSSKKPNTQNSTNENGISK